MKILVLCTLLMLTATQLTSAARKDMKCPRQEIPGCYCMEHSFLFRGPYVSCSDISDIDDLRRRLQPLKGNPIDGLKLDNVSFSYFPRDGLFLDTHIEYLWLSYSGLRYLAPADQKGPSPFQGLEDTLTQIKMEGLLDMENIDWAEFSSLHNLFRIEVYNSRFGKLDQSFAKLPSSLEAFDLLQGGLTSIDPGAFTLDNITSLSIAGNQIDRLDRNIFAAKPETLTAIMFSQNKVKEISEDFFSNLPAVTFVDIGRNRLTRLPSSLNQTWTQYESIYLAGNPLTCDCELTWLLRAAKERPPKYGDLEFLKCGGPAALAGQPLLSLQESDLCP